MSSIFYIFCIVWCLLAFRLIEEIRYSKLLDKIRKDFKTEKEKE